MIDLRRDDSTTEGSGTHDYGRATLAHLQTMRQGMAAVFAEEPVMGGSGVGIGDIG